MKNEVFYERAQAARDEYSKNEQYIHNHILSDIFVQFFENRDSFPDELIISGRSYSKDWVFDVLCQLGINFEKISQLGDYFLIHSPQLQ